MRITGGTLKGWQIPTHFAAHVRPTTDMVRESIFNKLQHGTGIENKMVLDLFSGSGIMALEFLSRGASAVVSADKDAKNILHQKEIKKLKELENWQIIKGDVFKVIPSLQKNFDIVFADPPYDLPGIQNLPATVIPLLSADGLFMLEHRPGIVFQGADLEIKNYGSTSITFFKKNSLD